MPPWPQTAGRFRAGLILTALLALAVPATWYAAHGAFWAPSHDDMVSLLLSSKGKSRADLVLSPPSTTRRSVREILGTIDPQPGYGVLDTVLDVYRLSINPPVYLGLLNLWRRILGKSFPMAVMLSVVACALSACALYWFVARERGWRCGLLVSALFCFSPTYWEAALAARQYALSALLSALLAGSAAVLLRTGRPASFRAAAAFVAAGTLMTWTAYQSVVLMLSLLAGFIAVALVRKDRRLSAVACTAAVAFAIASAPILLLARWQGVRGGHLGVPVNTLLPFGSPAETWRAALQLVLSLFVDLPYAHVAFGALALAVIALLGGLALLAAKEMPAPAAATLLAASLPSGIAFYAALVLLGQVPAWFALRYFVAYSCAYLVLLGLVEIPAPRADRIRRVVLGLLLSVSSATFILRTGQYVASGRQEEYTAFQDLRRAHAVLTDSRQHAIVLRIAAHASPEANLWLVRLPIDQAACRAIADDGRGKSVAVMWTRECDRADFETALRSCLPEMQEDRVIAHSWLDLKIWAPRQAAAQNVKAKPRAGPW